MQLTWMCSLKVSFIQYVSKYVSVGETAGDPTIRNKGIRPQTMVELG